MKLLNKYYRVGFFLFCFSKLLFAQSFPIVVAESFPPYQVMTNNGVNGLSVDVLKALNKHLGMKTHIELYPWARAYKMALTTPNVLILSISQTKERNDLFHWIGTLPISDKLTLWTLKNNQQEKVINWANLQGVVTALPRLDSNIDLLLDKGLLLNKDFFIVNQFKQVIGMLVKGRIDYIIAGSASLKYQIEALGYDVNHFTKQDIDSTRVAKISFAFNLDSNKRLIDDYKKAFDELAEKGRLQQIMAKWFNNYRAPLSKLSNQKSPDTLFLLTEVKP
ncbi:MAG: transporter substrate-binding domain-containing protein [Colwelliaceae bacterium]|nr:transporter substrate-binding domain-containing protein [Colwelliaceae bacterium]